jgi:hypothetical protein
LTVTVSKIVRRGASFPAKGAKRRARTSVAGVKRYVAVSYGGYCDSRIGG